MTPEQRVRLKAFGFSEGKNEHFNESEEISEFLDLMSMRYRDYPPLGKCQVCIHGGEPCTQADGVNVSKFTCFDFDPTGQEYFERGG